MPTVFMAYIMRCNSLKRVSALFVVAIAVCLLTNCNGFEYRTHKLVIQRHSTSRIYARATSTSEGNKAAQKVKSPAAIRSESPPETIIFAGVKFGNPIASSLKKMGIIEPSPIQKASLVPLTTGLTCILHAQTGSGKTFAYLLPLLKRLIGSDGAISRVPLQGLILVPTKELAVQVAADISTLLGIDATSEEESSGTEETEDHSPVHLCLTTSRKGLDEVKSPIVVGTPFKVLDAFRSSHSSSVSSFGFVVLDEVDRILNAVGRYATSDDKRVAKHDKMPIEEILHLLQETRKEGEEEGEEGGALQVVAASATVGRPMRREMFRLLNGGESFGDIPVIRPIDENDVAAADSAQQQGSTRKIGIPTTIRHIAMLTHDDSKEINSKLVVAKEKWVGEYSAAKRGLLFVPRPEDVRNVLGILRFWGVNEAQNLQQTLGIESAEQGKSQAAVAAAARGAAVGGTDAASSSETSLPTKRKGSRSAELIAKAASTRIGAASRLDRPPPLPLSEAGGGASASNDAALLLGGGDGKKKDDHAAAARDLFVVPVSGTRGLHVQDVEYVIILSPPKTMDEYLHMAGRTGREGNKSKGGTVISLVSFDELKRLKSWETALGIQFDVEYQ